MADLYKYCEDVDGYINYQPSTPQWEADNIVDYVRQKRPLHLAVDVGCGTGQNTFVFARHFDRVIGVDVSEPMIRKAVELNKDSTNVQFAVAPAEDLSVVDIKDHSVDLLTCAFCLHWFDLPKFFAEAKRVLAPNGVLAVVTQKFAPHHPTDPIKGDQLVAIRDDFLKTIPSNLSVTPAKILFLTCYEKVEFPLEDIFRGFVGSSVVQMSVSKLRFTTLQLVPFKKFDAEQHEKMTAILDTFQDRLMDVVGEQGRQSDPDVALVHYKVDYHLVLGRMNVH